MNDWRLRREDLMTPEEWRKLRKMLDERAERAERHRGWTARQEQAICLVAVWTGLRRHEMAALNIGDLSLHDEMPFIVVRHGKGDHPREVLISPECRAFLKGWLREKAGHGDPMSLTDPVFYSQRGRYAGDGIYRVWASCCRRAGIPPRSIHKARHLFATLLYSTTKDLRLVQKQLGHQRITTTEIYADICDDDAAAGMKLLDKALKVTPKGAARKRPSDC